MKRIYSLFVIVLYCLDALGQQYVPFPEYFRPKEIYYELDTSSFLNDSAFVVFGYYKDQFSSDRYYSVIAAGDYMHDDKQYWTELARDTDFRTNPWTLYYNQLDRLAIKYQSGHYLISAYGSSLNYLLKIDGQEDEWQLDSIQQASGINDLAISNDSIMYANVVNNGQNFIVKKEGMAGWETLPIIVSQPGALERLPNIMLWAIIIVGLVVLALFVWAEYKDRQIEKFIEDQNPNSNELKLTADKPLGYEDILKKKNKDTLSAIHAITDVIKNRNTPLPMTIAINGAWGSGKSTIMNCIRELLDKDENERYITTWFNAWHQQSESSLLDAFLLKVIDRYEKPFFNSWWKSFLAFWKFRIRLASSRFIKWAAYTQLFTGFAIGFLLLTAIIILINAYGLFDADIFKQSELLGINVRDYFNDNSLNSIGSFLQTIAAVILPIVSFFFLRSESKPTIGAFLNVMYKDAFLLDAEKSNPGMREKFRTQYWEIMEAVGDRVLVVFIDDLDRVTGDKIFEMLEAINFIGDVTSRPDDYSNSSLKTVFVLGMYIEQVAEQLGVFLQKENPSFEKDLTEEKKRDQAIALGKRYIEKMIQLNVPVPLTKEEDITT